MKDLIERLRDTAKWENDCGSPTLLREAADALERLTAGDVEMPEPTIEFMSGHRKPVVIYDTSDIKDYGDRRAAAAVLSQPGQPASTNVGSLTDTEITSIAYDCNALPEVVTDATLAVFARAIEARSRALAQPVQPTYDTRQHSNLTNQAHGFAMGGCPACGSQSCVARSCLSQPVQPHGASMMMPTMNLRFVERGMTSNQDESGRHLPDGVARTFTVQVLQQQFVSVTSPESEWRDVPVSLQNLLDRREIRA